MQFYVALTALSCDPILEAPLNGMMECDKQTVGGTCNFTCDEGYTLRGSDSRTCLPSLQWREPPAICDPPMCPHLSPPDSGFVLFPCTREEGHLCRVDCAHGYTLVGPSNQTCRNNNTGSLVWSDGPQCEGQLTSSSDKASGSNQHFGSITLFLSSYNIIVCQHAFITIAISYAGLPFHFRE